MFIGNNFWFSLDFFVEYDKNFRQDLYVGEHRHEFSFKLPENLPTSYENKHAYVRYYLKAKFYRPEWTKTDYEFKEHFTVIGLIDLNGDRRAIVRLSFLCENFIRHK